MIEFSRMLRHRRAVRVGFVGRAVRVGLVGALLFAAIIIFSSNARDGNAQFAGRVAGIVVNGTAGGTVPEGFEVVLVTTDLDGNPMGQQTTRVDSRGVFEFTNVLSGDDVLNRVVTDYQGVISTIRLEEEVAPANLQIQIFETTRSLDSINVLTEVIVVRPDGPSRLMGFLELITLRNDGDRTFVADLTDPNVTGLSMVRFGLPENYEGFTGVSIDPPLPAGSIVEVGPGFALTNPVPPGEFRLLFDYFVRYEGNAFEFGRNLPFGAKEVRVLMPKGVAEVTGNGIASIEDVTLGNSVYSVTGGGAYGRGDRIDLKFIQLPEPSVWQSIKNRLRAANTYVKVGVPVAAGVVMAGLLGYVFLMRRRREPAAASPISTDGVEEPRASSAGDNPEREALVREIASLDQRFEAGEIEESAYRAQRAALSARALGESPTP
ncbi:MAG: hypothetical protein HYY34_06940 [Chloroflexi bacterium]|nr:hypothetical protein [Chloroflexota bacterium]